MISDLIRRHSVRTLATTASVGAMLAIGAWLPSSPASAQDAVDQPPQIDVQKQPAAEPAPRVEKRRRKQIPHKAKLTSGTQTAQMPAPSAQAAPSPAAPSPAEPASKVASPAVAPSATPKSPDFAAALRNAGAGACGSAVDALAGTTMADVASYNTLSSWSTASGNGRAVSLESGQKYVAGSAVPFAASTIVAAPNARGSCDAYAIQVVPSPLSCDTLRQSMARGGQQIAQLAGIPVMQNGGDRTMLVPTNNNTCVLVATRARYAP